MPDNLTCPKCGTTNSPIDYFCRKCGQDLYAAGATKPAEQGEARASSAIPAAPQGPPVRPRDFYYAPFETLRKRYERDYSTARILGIFGLIVKILAVVCAVVVIVAALWSGLRTGSLRSIAIGLIVGGLQGLLTYLSGVMITSFGWILQSTADTVVSTSPFLDNDEKIKVLSLMR